jgi:hypothetical protein
MTHYVEVATHRPASRGVVRDLALLKPDSRVPSWRSYFSFDDRLQPFVDKFGALRKAYPHDVYCDQIVLDFDSSDLEEARRDAVNTVRYLTAYHEMPPDWIRPFFSGKKGFHIHLPGEIFGIKPKPDLPQYVKATIDNEFGGIGTTLDTSMIMSQGLIRLPGTIHNSGERFKVALTLGELMRSEMGDILDLAAATRDPMLVHFPYDREPFALMQRCIMKPEAYTEMYREPTTSEIVGRHVVCMQHLLNSGPKEGSRHNELLRLSSSMRRNGMPAPMVVSALREWVGPSFAGAEVTRVVRGVFEGRLEYGCHDSIMAAHCDSRCMYHDKKNLGMSTANEVRGADQLYDNLRGYYSLLASGRGLDLKKAFPWMEFSYKVLPGECVQVTGDTGMGKTALVQQIVQSTDEEVLWVNMEMKEEQVFRRSLQCAHNLTKAELSAKIVSDYGRTEGPGLTAPIQHIKILSVAPNPDSIAEIIASHNSKVVVLDTTDAIEIPGAGNNENYQMKATVELMRRLSQKRGIIIIGIHHINKQGSRESTGEMDKPRPLTLNDLTGNRSNVTKMDHVLAVEGMRDSTKRHLRSLKGRDESPLHLGMEFDWQRFRMRRPDGQANVWEE